MSAVALRLAGAAFLLAAAMPAAAFDQTQAPANESAADERGDTPKASTEEKDDGKSVGERKICKRIATTGTRMGEKRVCMSRDAWRKAGY